MLLPLPFIVGLALLGMAGVFVLGKSVIRRYSVPWFEIYLKKGVLVWMDVGSEIIPMVVKPKNGYFVVYTDKVKGFFHIVDSRIKLMGGRVPTYYFTPHDMNNIDPQLVDEFERWADNQELDEVKKKDIIHSDLLRGILKRKSKLTDAHDELKERSTNDLVAMENVLVEGEDAVQQLMKQNDTDKGKEHVYSEQWKSDALVKYLRSKGVIDEQIHNNLIFKIYNGVVNYGQLLEELRAMNVISITEPASLRVTRYIKDFGSQDPFAIINSIFSLKTNKKGLKGLTPVPVKSWIPGGTILAIGLVVIFIIVLISNGTISGDMLGKISIPGLPGAP